MSVTSNATPCQIMQKMRHCGDNPNANLCSNSQRFKVKKKRKSNMNIKHKVEGSSSVLELKVEFLNVDNIATREELGSLMDNRHDGVSDMSQRKLFDGSGLASLISRLHAARNRSGDFILSIMTRAVRALSEFKRMHRMLRINESRPQAIASLA